MQQRWNCDCSGNFFLFLEKFWDRPQVRIRSLNHKAGDSKLHQQALNNAYLTTRYSSDSLRKWIVQEGAQIDELCYFCATVRLLCDCATPRSHSVLAVPKCIPTGLALDNTLYQIARRKLKYIRRIYAHIKALVRAYGHIRSGQRHMHMAKYHAYISAYICIYTVCIYRHVCLLANAGISCPRHWRIF